MGKIVNVATIGTVHCVETNYKGKLQWTTITRIVGSTRIVPILKNTCTTQGVNKYLTKEKLSQR